MSDQAQDYIEESPLNGVFLIARPVLEDPRGFFRETFRKADLEARLGFAFEPVQQNHSRSSKDTLRGIHIAPWHKLVTCMNGTVQQVVVDTRPESETFGQFFTVILGEGNFNSVFIPASCGNAFLVTSEQADYNYLTTEYWSVGKENEIAWNDPTIGITWQTSSPVLSEKDINNPKLSEVFPEKFNS